MASLLASDVLTPRQLTFIAERLPEPPCALRGRRPYSNLAPLPGILLDRPGHPFFNTQAHYRNLLHDQQAVTCAIVGAH